ncbi:hypothetical protein BDP55DRAFT_651701 [Colletotrichum godetiae]|uniref:Uncharacterized protein n=1 Tax=Colletotrichum godetiae TaxID=1209918 RepID=A0AAJ0AT03_9PEZI|nr:uncharacterized protein BDP55DRAFT_651701 [Colletotrichum godetiae]KAK1689823.1 hypothetical protein BDP55DRAFT_651701 [Colletotrichum godetiae]
MPLPTVRLLQRPFSLLLRPICLTFMSGIGLCQVPTVPLFRSPRFITLCSSIKASASNWRSCHFIDLLRHLCHPRQVNREAGNKIVYRQPLQK